MGHYASEMNLPEQAPKEEFFGSYNGFRIGYKPGLANGWIELRDKDDKIIGHIDGVSAVYLARHSRS